MKSIEFVSAVLNGKIFQYQPLGIINIQDEKPTVFTAGRFSDGRFVPQSETQGHFLSTPTYLRLRFSEMVRYRPQEDNVKIIDSTGYITGLPRNQITIKDEKDTIYTSREQFENKMNKLMKTVKTKENFPLFVRDLSKIPGW